MVARRPSLGMRIAYVLSLRQGIHSFVYRELEELERRGVHFSILAVSEGPGPYRPKREWNIIQPSAMAALIGAVYLLSTKPGYLIAVSIRAMKTHSLADLALALAFAIPVRRWGARSVHAHFGDHKLFVGHYLHGLLDIPLSVTIHAYELYANPNPGLFLEALESCARVVTVSDYNREVLAREYGVDRRRISVIREFPWSMPGPVSTPTNEFTILCVARFVPKKGHDILLRAVRRLVDLGHRDVRLVLVGKGPLDIQALVREYGLQLYTTIYEDVSDGELRSLYAASDVFCLTSRVAEGGDREGIPVSLMEAMAYGKPVVATAVAGIPELVRKTLVPEGDVDATADALLRLKEEPQLATLQRQENRAIVAARYSPQNVDELVEVFRSIQNETA